MAPRFLNICATMRGFNIFKKDAWVRPHAYPGMVVASADAFYLAIDPSKMLRAVNVIGGAVGGAASALMGRKKAATYLPLAVPLVEETELAKLPAKITNDPDWPVTWDDGPVIVVPRDAVQGLRTTFWLGGIQLSLEGVAINVFTPVFQRKRLAAQLVEMGWEVAGV